MKWTQLNGSLNFLWHCLSLGLEWKLTFSSPVTISKFSKYAGIFECSILTTSSFRILNSSAAIPSPLLALFVVMLPKDYLISDSQHVWLSHHCSPFLYSSVSSCHLFLISSASVRLLTFLSFIVSIFAWNVPLVSLEKEMATHPSIPAWEIPWTEDPGGLQSMGLQKSWTWIRH